MDLNTFALKDLLSAAIAAEQEAQAVYTALSRRVRNFMLQDRLRFLAAEEERHAVVVRTIFDQECPGQSPELGAPSPVPLPRITIPAESVPLSEILLQAVAAERAAHDFYMSLSARFSDNAKTAWMLRYLARMENAHITMFEEEVRSLEEREAAEDIFPMSHLGP